MKDNWYNRQRSFRFRNWYSPNPYSCKIRAFAYEGIELTSRKRIVPKRNPNSPGQKQLSGSFSKGVLSLQIQLQKAKHINTELQSKKGKSNSGWRSGSGRGREEPAVAADVGLLRNHAHGELGGGFGCGRALAGRRREQVHGRGEECRAEGVAVGGAAEAGVTGRR